MRKSWGVWLNYPFWKAVALMSQDWYVMRWETKAHIIACGPIAFAVFWRLPARPTPSPEPRRE